MRYAVFLQLFFVWNGALYREHFASVYEDEDTTPMGKMISSSKEMNIMHEADDIAVQLRALNPKVVE